MSVTRPEEARPSKDDSHLMDHKDLHSERGALAGEHPGRAANPVVKVRGLAWLEWEKRDLDRSRRFSLDFGFDVHARTADALYLRGALAGTPCVVVRKGARSRFVAAAFQAAESADLDRLARATGGSVEDAAGEGGGRMVRLTDPNGFPVKVVHGVEEISAQPTQAPSRWNVGPERPRTNATQRPPLAPARVERLGHLVIASRIFRRSLDWYLQHLGLIVSDFLYLEGQRERGPVMAFIRCDRGLEPSDHHTLAMLLKPDAGYVHSAFEVADLDALAAGGQYLAERGYKRSWGIGRHIQGSQVFDYWRDPDKVMIEHYTDGDLFDNTLDPGWAPMTASGLAQWGPRASGDFLGTPPSLTMVRCAIEALREGNEIDLARLRGLIKALGK